MNFTSPLSISKGRNQDAVIVKIKNPEMFISKETGAAMEDREGATLLADKIPKQVPWGVDASIVKKRAEASAMFVKAMMVTQIVLSVFLKGAMNDLWGLYFTLQLMCYMNVYDTSFPQSAEDYLKEFTKIIEFDILSPEGAMKVINPDFDLRAYITGQAVAINKDQEASVMKDMQVYIMGSIIAVFALVFAITIMLVFKKYANKIKTKLLKIKDQFLWNGAVRSLYISFAQILMTTSIQFKMIVRGSRYVDMQSYAVCIGTSVYCVVSIIMITIALYIYKNRLNEPKIQDTYGNMYTGVYVSQIRGYKIYYWPIFLARRIIFFVIPVVLFYSETLQLQFLCFYTSIYVIIITSIKPHLDKRDMRKETFNEVMTMMSCYHMFCFSEFNLDDENKYMMGHSYVFFVAGTFSYNVFLMVLKNAEKFKRKQRMIGMQSYFRTNQEFILRTEHVDRLYEAKKKLNTNFNLKSEFEKQEERRMIKKMERAYLKAQDEVRQAAKNNEKDNVQLNPIIKSTTKKSHKKSVTVMEEIKEEITHENVSSDEENDPKETNVDGPQQDDKREVGIKYSQEATNIEKDYLSQLGSMLKRSQSNTDQKMKTNTAKLMKKQKSALKAIETQEKEEAQSSERLELMDQSPIEPKSPISPSKINLLSNMKHKMSMQMKKQ